MDVVEQGVSHLELQPQITFLKASGSRRNDVLMIVWILWGRVLSGRRWCSSFHRQSGCGTAAVRRRTSALRCSSLFFRCVQVLASLRVYSIRIGQANWQWAVETVVVIRQTSSDTWLADVVNTRIAGRVLVWAGLDHSQANQIETWVEASFAGITGSSDSRSQWCLRQRTREAGRSGARSLSLFGQRRSRIPGSGHTNWWGFERTEIEADRYARGLRRSWIRSTLLPGFRQTDDRVDRNRDLEGVLGWRGLRPRSASGPREESAEQLVYRFVFGLCVSRSQLRLPTAGGICGSRRDRTAACTKWLKWTFG